MADNLLEVKRLATGYGDVQVLWGIDLEVSQGDTVSIVGSNGAGKTTLLSTISGLLPVWDGKILIDGEDVTGAGTEHVLSKGVALVPEGRRLFKGMNVRDNLLLGAYLRRHAAAIDADLDYVFELFPILKERQSQDATTLSGGEQQMCAIARGIMSRPKLLMIDELSLGLAPRMVETLAESLTAINESGVTILLVEQDVMTAFEITRQAYVIELGRVTNRGETRGLADDPRIREAYLGI